MLPIDQDCTLSDRLSGKYHISVLLRSPPSLTSSNYSLVKSPVGLTMASDRLPSMTAADTPDLLGIPFEIRLNVYKFMFVHWEPIRLEVKRDGTIKALNVSSVSLSLQMLETCRQVRLEATPIVYQCNNYIVPWEKFQLHQSPRPVMSDYLRTITIDCTSGDIWGFVKPIKDLSKLLTGLREINLTFGASGRFMAAALEISNAIPACSQSFAQPVLQLIVSPKDDDLAYHEGSQYLYSINHTLMRSSTRLRDILRHGGPRPTELLITPNDAPRLPLIKLIGQACRRLKPVFEAHRCSVGLCGFVKDREELMKRDNTMVEPVRRHHYTWREVNGPRSDVDPNMKQWLPDIPNKHKEILREFLRSQGVAVDDDVSENHAPAPQATRPAQRRRSSPEWGQLIEITIPQDGASQETLPFPFGTQLFDYQLLRSSPLDLQFFDPEPEPQPRRLQLLESRLRDVQLLHNPEDIDLRLLMDPYVHPRDVVGHNTSYATPAETDEAGTDLDDELENAARGFAGLTITRPESDEASSTTAQPQAPDTITQESITATTAQNPVPTATQPASEFTAAPLTAAAMRAAAWEPLVGRPSEDLTCLALERQEALLAEQDGGSVSVHEAWFAQLQKHCEDAE